MAFPANIILFLRNKENRNRLLEGVSVKKMWESGVFFTKTSLGGRFVLKHCRDLPGGGGRDSAAQPAAACAIPGDGGFQRFEASQPPAAQGFSGPRPYKNEFLTAGYQKCPVRCTRLQIFERKTGFGPATSTLARLRSTN